MADKYHTFEEWYEALKALFSDQHLLDCWEEEYSFKQAFEDGMTPEQAKADCDEWLNS